MTHFWIQQEELQYVTSSTLLLTNLFLIIMFFKAHGVFPVGLGFPISCLVSKIFLLVYRTVHSVRIGLPSFRLLPLMTQLSYRDLDISYTKHIGWTNRQCCQPAEKFGKITENELMKS